MTLRAVLVSREEPFFTPEYVMPVLKSSDVEIICMYIDRRPSPHLGMLDILRLSGIVGAIKLAALMALKWIPGGLGAVGYPGSRSISRAARNLGIVVKTINSVDGSFVSEIETLAPDILISVANSHVMPDSVLNISGMTALNSHSSLLPAYRGILTAFWTLYDGRQTSGVTIHKMLSSIDSGDIVAQSEFEISEGETMFSYYRKAAQLGGGLWAQVLAHLNATDPDSRLSVPAQLSGASHQNVFTKPTRGEIAKFRAAGKRFI
jgi:folate-dependent phosphoribosylglycinamide formyltransferase PurN